MIAVLEPRFHGNGFVQVYLNAYTRLHIWSPDLPATRVKNAQIHDHRFWFHSRVLHGAIQHEEFGVELDGVGNHGLYETQAHSKVAPLRRVGKCSLVRRDLWVYLAGDSYYFGGPGQFHQTSAAEFTVTLMTKLHVADGYSARIVALNDHEPDHAFEHQPPVGLLNATVRKALHLIAPRL